MIAVKAIPGQKLYLLDANPTAENLAQHLLTEVSVRQMAGAGVEVIKAARAANYHPAVALLTAFPVAEEDWQEMGADKLLVKPMHTRILLQQIEDLIASHERKLAELGLPATAAKPPAKPTVKKKAVVKKAVVKKAVKRTLPKKLAPAKTAVKKKPVAKKATVKKVTKTALKSKPARRRT